MTALAHHRVRGLSPALRASALSVAVTQLWDTLSVAFARVVASSVSTGTDFVCPASGVPPVPEDFFPPTY